MNDSDVKLLWKTESFFDTLGVIRVELWPEGLVIWVSGMIVWKSWERKK
jgi:hypothetical protein